MNIADTEFARAATNGVGIGLRIRFSRQLGEG